MAFVSPMVSRHKGGDAESASDDGDKSKVRRNEHSKAAGSGSFSESSLFWLIVVPLVLLTFLCGLYLGSSIASPAASEAIDERPLVQPYPLNPDPVRRSDRVPPVNVGGNAASQQMKKPPPINWPPPATRPPATATVPPAVIPATAPPEPSPTAPPAPLPPIFPAAVNSLYTKPHADGGWLDLPNPMEFGGAAGSTFSVFISLSGTSDGIRTILTNKAAGCPSDEAHRGFSLYVNNWGSKDGKLVLEYGTTSSGCQKFDSGAASVPVSDSAAAPRWVHVAATLDSGSNLLALYLDGRAVGSKNVEPSDARRLQLKNHMVVGANLAGEDPLKGQLSTLLVFDRALTAREVGSLYTLSLDPSLEALEQKAPSNLRHAYPLTDAVDAVGLGNMPAKDVRALLAGVYRLPKNVDFEPQGGGRYVEYAGGALKVEAPVGSPVRVASDSKARVRREQIKEAMKHAWDGYKKYAYGYDELKPLSKRGTNNWGGMGTTLVDSLDTLWLMGMKDEFWEARDWVRDHLEHDHVGMVSVFETTIRSLGGLLSAYDLSGDPAFLEKAKDLGSRLVHAFDSPTGIPYGQTMLNGHTSMNAGWTGGSSLLAEIGTLQVEFRYLSKVTGDPSYAQKADKVFEIMQPRQPSNGLFPIYIDPNSGGFNNNKITFGAMGDSFYEYMLKCWLQGGKTESMYRSMYDKAMEGVHSLLAHKSTPSGLSYIADLNSGRVDHKMDHLVCFMGGSLALGAYTNPDGLQSPAAQRDLKLGKALTYTCYQMYARMATGISAEYVKFTPGNDFEVGSNAPFYILRPETAESFFILHQLTGDPVYREWGWEVFQAIEKYCRTEVAYGGLSDVRNANLKPEDRMESFFLAETMKYLYLLQDPETEIDVLNTHVFNTEAHPTRKLGLVNGPR